MSAYVSAGLPKEVRNFFGDCCGYCRSDEQLCALTFESEHIQPRVAGVPTVFEKQYPACPASNRFKGVRTSAVDPQTGQAVLLFHPQQNEWGDHVGWNAGATEIAPVTMTGRATIAALRMNRPALIKLRRIWSSVDRHPPSGQ